MTPAGIEPTTSQALHREGSLLIITSCVPAQRKTLDPRRTSPAFLLRLGSNHASRLDPPEMNPPLVDV